MLCAVALSSSMSRTRICIPFPAAIRLSELPVSQRQLPVPDNGMQWLTKYDSPLQAQFAAFSFCRYLFESKHKSQNPKVNATV
jgi:hypothetical protein